MAASSPEHAPAGVLLAAGRARRMGRTKQLMPVRTSAGTLPMIAAAFDLLSPVCASRMIVVTGHDAAAVVAALAPREFVEARSDPDADMFHSVRLGLGAARRQFPSAGAYWLHLADHPFVHAGTVASLQHAYQADAGRRVVMPEHAGKGGHPVVVPGAVVDALLAWRGEGGLRAFWLQRADLCLRLRVDDPGAVRDVDTPADYHAGTA